MYSVAPLVGARVEIAVHHSDSGSNSVAPLVGARVEISHWERLLTGHSVAPLVGARVEILVARTDIPQQGQSLPSWERGLKFITS